MFNDKQRSVLLLEGKDARVRIYKKYFPPERDRPLQSHVFLVVHSSVSMSNRFNAGGHNVDANVLQDAQPYPSAHSQAC